MFRRVARLIRVVLLLGSLSAILVFASCLPRKPQPADQLTYKGPTEISIAATESLPCTDIVYVGVRDEMAQFTIQGLEAQKKVGDSLDWQGEPVGGTSLDLGLRIIMIGEENVHTAGTVSIQINGAQIVPGPADTSGCKFSVPVVYGIEVGDTIPGTEITYEGRDEERGAQLGIEGYPYRKGGDSVDWEGHLRDNVDLQLSLRVLYYSDEILRVGGIATLWLNPAPAAVDSTTATHLPRVAL